MFWTIDFWWKGVKPRIQAQYIFRNFLSTADFIAKRTWLVYVRTIVESWLKFCKCDENKQVNAIIELFLIFFFVALLGSVSFYQKYFHQKCFGRQFNFQKCHLTKCHVV
jgi:hypothetical protein